MIQKALGSVRLGAVPTVYLDLCCYNRPFDDQSQARVHLEAEAVLAIVERTTNADWQLVGGAVLQSEVRATPSADRRKQVLDFMEAATQELPLIQTDLDRAKVLEGLGFRPYDSLHLACAERASVDVFLTTDDRLIRTAKRQAQHLRVRVENPLVWLAEVT